MPDTSMTEIDPKTRRSNILLALALAGLAVGVLLTFMWVVGSQS